MKASDLLVKCLENEGVKYIFGVAGEEIMHILNSLRGSSIKFVTTRHEQCAAFMASVVGRLTGKPGVCLATLGPGATNLTTGLADTQLDYAPVVAITGQTNLRRAHKETKQFVDIVSHFKPITKWNAQVDRADVIPEVVRKAFKIAQAEKPGACHLEVPSDVAGEEVKGRPMLIRQVTYPYPDEKILKEAADIINHARNPIILAGNGIIRSNASKELRNFVHHTQLPVANTFMSMGSVPADDPLCLLSVGLQSRDYVNCGFDDADVVIAIGYDFTEYDPQGWNPQGDKKIVHVDILPPDVDFHYTPAVELLGDIRESLRLLIGRTKPKISSARKVLRDYILREIEECARDEGFPVKPQRIINDIRSVLNRDDILVSDVGAHLIWVARMYQAYEPNSVLISFGFASMGFGVPAAISAKLLNPGKKVVAVCGDGGFMMASMELETACRLKTPFTVVIFNDNGYGLIKWKQVNEFGVDFGSDFNNPDFVKYAESFGMKGYRISSTRELLPALQDSLKQKMPTIIDVPVDYRENLRLSEKLGNLICPVG